MKALSKKAISVFVLLCIVSTLFSGVCFAADTEQKTQEWTGWLIDYDCVGANPSTHTQNCNLMPMCIASGEGIYIYEEGKAFNTYNASNWLPFDAASQELAKKLDLVLSDPSNAKAYLKKYPNKIPTIKVTGYTVTTDLPSGIKDYNTAIHITSIEFIYIKDVSAYEVTAPENVVLKEKDAAPSKAVTPKAQAKTGAGKNAASQWSISITGAKSKTVAFTSAQFAKLAKVTVKTTKKCSMEDCKNSGMMNKTQSWSGVTLANVLNYLGVKKYKSVTVVGKDGYTKSYLPAIANAKGTILASKLDGKDLSSASGPIELVVSGQKENLWIKNVAKIIIKV